MSDMSEARAANAVMQREQTTYSEPFAFTGSGGEYFRIWAVNWLLTMVTLGIYSPWAKVRRLKYFHQHTLLAGHRFDYHGSPLTILKGRLIGLALFLLVAFVPFAGLLFLPLLPLLLRGSMRFHLRNTSYRGMRFNFSGSARGAYFVFLLGSLLSTLSFGLLAPYAHKWLKEYQHGNASYGDERFGFSSPVGPFYRIYLLSALLLVVLAGSLTYLFGGLLSGLLPALPVPPAEGEGADLGMIMHLVAAVFISNIVLALVVAPFFAARMANLTWSSTRLGRHALRSRLSAGGLIWIYITNFLLVVFTLGLFTPWALVDIARYRVQAMALLPAGPLDEFIASRQAEVSAVGQETAEWFDMDIGL